MRPLNLRRGLTIVGYFCLSVILIGDISGQTRGGYRLNEQGQLEMVVHIIGEIDHPGEYTILDGTNLVQLIAKAGGPTQFSKLSRVTIARMDRAPMTNGQNGKHRIENKIIRYNAENFLNKRTFGSPPLLKPGDIVMVPRNAWHKWRFSFALVRDLSVIASLYLLYLRID